MNVNTMIHLACTMYGDVLAMAIEGDTAAAQLIKDNPMPSPDIEMDRVMLQHVGMDVSTADVMSLREWYDTPNR
jgi:hypothetical protein